jgi:transposase, IS6 family
MIKNEFKWKHFSPEIILWCLRWYGSTPMSYANLSDMLAERGISVNRSTIYRWFIEYAPVLRKKLRRHQFIRTDTSWQLDETYVKMKGKWHYLYRAINKQGETFFIRQCDCSLEKRGTITSGCRTAASEISQ